MTAKEIKILLITKGLSVAEMARELEKDSNATAKSLEVMIHDTLYGKRFIPSIASKINKKFGIKIERPAHLQTIRHQLKNAA